MLDTSGAPRSNYKASTQYLTVLLYTVAWQARHLVLCKGSDARPGVPWSPPLCRWLLRGRAGGFCVAGAALGAMPRGRPLVFVLQILHKALPSVTPHSRLHTPPLTLHTSHSTLHTPHFPLHIPHSTFHTPHLTLTTPHSTLHTPHSTLHASHFTLNTPHFTLHTSHFTL